MLILLSLFILHLPYIFDPSPKINYSFKYPLFARLEPQKYRILYYEKGSVFLSNADDDLVELNF